MAIFDNGKAPITQSAEGDIARVPRSPFNMSRVIVTNGLIGKLMPIDLIETVPNEDYKIGYSALAKSRNPLVRRLENGMKMYFHSYWVAKRDLWEGWDNYIDKGRSGTVLKEVPKYYPGMRANGDTTSGIGPGTADYNCITPFSPLAYMGAPIACYDPTANNGNKNKAFLPMVNNTTNAVNNACGQWGTTEKAKWGISALPLVMYCKIKRDYYMNQNLVDKNKNWFPDNEHDALILPYDLPSNNQGYCNVADGRLTISYDADRLDDNSGEYIPTNNDVNSLPILNCLYNRAFKGDYFTTSSPFQNLMRGDLDQYNIDDTIDWDDVFVNYNNTDSTTNTGLLGFNTVRGKFEGANMDANGVTVVGVTATNTIRQAFAKAKIKSGVTLNNLRRLVVLEKMMMRNAKTQGTYKELIGVQFGYFPKVHDRKPIYIGGCYMDIGSSEVTQLSESSATSVLGQENSKLKGASSGFNGRFHSDDYGYIMTICTIMPDVYYDNQGLDTIFTRTTNDKEYFPILNNLEPNEIKNKELFISDNDTWNEQPFGYKNRFEELKSRQNKVIGLGACGNKAVFDSCTFMKRRFTNANKPGLCAEWLEMSQDNIDMEMFTSKNEPPFDLIIGCNIDKVSPMPMTATPADMGIKY